MKHVPEREDELTLLKKKYFDATQNIFIMLQPRNEVPDEKPPSKLKISQILFDYHNAGVDYFNAFERTIDEYGLSSIELNHDTKNRKSEDALNIVQTIFDHWRTANEFCSVFALIPPKPSIASYASIQRVIKEFHPKEAAKLKIQFKEMDLPVFGFESKTQHSGWKKDDVRLQLLIGVPLLFICGVLTFVFQDITGMQYLFLRYLLALSISLLGSAFLQGFANLKWSIGQSFLLTASGSVAIFILLVYFNPPLPPT